jgi:uncharacterized protein YggT (Ycf19 family)
MFYPLASLVNVIVGILELLLGLRFFFKFFGIGTASTFVNWLYSFTQPIVNPFIGILPSFSFGGFLIETATILAMVVIGLVGYFLTSFFSPSTHSHTY